VTINEFLSPKYDFQVCTNAACTITKSFGINYLESRGVETSYLYVWYGFGVIIAEYFLFVALTYAAIKLIRLEPTPPIPIIVPFDEVRFLACFRINLYDKIYLCT
jgi:hypothetical protein